MMEEDKELLIGDLCARLPYGVILNNPDPYGNNWDELISVDVSTKTVVLLYNGRRYDIENVKPYLRPLESMTEEEKKELSRKYNWRIANNIIQIRYHSDGYWDDETDCPTEEYFNLLNWLNKHHFDYRGLIDSGLALVAPEGMYE